MTTTHCLRRSCAQKERGPPQPPPHSAIFKSLSFFSSFLIFGQRFSNVLIFYVVGGCCFYFCFCSVLFLLIYELFDNFSQIEAHPPNKQGTNTRRATCAWCQKTSSLSYVFPRRMDGRSVLQIGLLSFRGFRPCRPPPLRIPPFSLPLQIPIPSTYFRGTRQNTNERK